MPRADAPLAVWHRSSGFTLLEMLVVLAITGLIAGLLFPQVQTAAFALQQRHAREQIAAGAESARGLAVRSGQPAMLSVVADGSGLVVGNPAVDNPGRAWRQFPLGAASGLVLTLRPQSILFYPDGSTTGGQLQLMSASQSSPATTKTYVIDRDAGRVREGGA